MHVKKYQANGIDILCIYGFRKGIWYDRLAWYVADANSVWSWRKIEAVQSFHVDSGVCVHVGNDVSEWFSVNVWLKQGCVISPFLFNVFVDGVVWELNVRVLGNGLELLSVNEGRFEINQLLFADDTALVVDTRRSCVDWYVSLVKYVKGESWEWMWVRMKLWGAPGMVMGIECMWY